jgi:hypothetical protein
VGSYTASALYATNATTASRFSAKASAAVDAVVAVQSRMMLGIAEDLSEHSSLLELSADVVRAVLRDSRDARCSCTHAEVSQCDHATTVTVQAALASLWDTATIAVVDAVSQKALTMVDGCMRSGYRAACMAVANGALTHGLLDGLHAFNNLALELIARSSGTTMQVPCSACSGVYVESCARVWAWHTRLLTCARVRACVWWWWLPLGTTPILQRDRASHFVDVRACVPLCVVRLSSTALPGHHRH